MLIRFANNICPLNRLTVQQITVRLGEYDFKSNSTSRKDFRVTKIVINRGYSRADKIQAHDIALLLLTQKVTFDSSIRPICLPSNNVVLERQAGYVTGK